MGPLAGYYDNFISDNIHIYIKSIVIVNCCPMKKKISLSN